MSCPQCGDDCRCFVESRPTSSTAGYAKSAGQTIQDHTSARSLAGHGATSEVLYGPGDLDCEFVDSEALDHSEEQFAASLEGDSYPQLCDPEPVEEAMAAPLSSAVAVTVAAVLEVMDAGGEQSENTGEMVPAVPVSSLAPAPDAWKTEVAARMENYRARRTPRPPRYPSLMLKFDPPEPEWLPAAASSSPLEPVVLAEVEQSLALNSEPITVASAAPAGLPQTSDTGGKIIEFPRLSHAYPVPLEELADPVLDRPRILEAPEVILPPPSLGGILIDAAEQEPDLKRPGIDVPLESSTVERRLAAAAVDAVIVLAAVAAFGGIFFRLATPKLPLLQIATGAGALFGVWWGAYQYLLMVYAGNTIGARLAKLQLLGFDGRPADRRQRRRRVLAAVLSAASLGMGYAWYFLDEDGLCWHDRITHTHLGPRHRGSSPQA